MESIMDSIVDSLFSVCVTLHANLPNLYDARNLVILDRNVDMTTPLYHTWTYQALAHDVHVEKQKLVIPIIATNSSPFSTVAEAIQEELEP
jgi:hypothetical protein